MNGGQPEADYAVRPARAKLDQGEHRLSYWFNVLLERVLTEPCWFTAIDHSAKAIGGGDKMAVMQAQMVWRERQKKMGIRPAHLDFYLYQVETGIYAQFELKSPTGGYPTAGQETTMRLLSERRIPNGWGRSIAAGYEFLCRAGFRLHPNAANIVAEITERHAAAEREAAVKRAAPRKRGRAPKAQPRYLWGASHP